MQNYIDKVSGTKWFHAIDFGDFASQGRFEPGRPQNITLYGAFEFINHLNLNNARVLDIGTSDGLVAFGCKGIGAKSVSAIDTFNDEAFHLSSEILGYTNSDIEYQSGIQMASLRSKFEASSLCLVVCCGIIYHMLRPMEAFTEARKILKQGGIFIIETPYEYKRNDAVLVFNGIEKVVNETYTYFVPTKSALEGMALLSGFKILAYRILKAPKRITYLLQAVNRQSLIDSEETPEFIVQMLKRDTCDDGFRFKDIENSEVKTSGIEFTNINLDYYREVDPNKENVKFPYHPPLDKPAYGVTRFEQKDGNTKTL